MFASKYMRVIHNLLFTCNPWLWRREVFKIYLSPLQPELNVSVFIWCSYLCNGLRLHESGGWFSCGVCPEAAKINGPGNNRLGNNRLGNNGPGNNGPGGSATDPAAASTALSLRAQSDHGWASPQTLPRLECSEAAHSMCAGVGMSLRLQEDSKRPWSDGKGNSHATAEWCELGTAGAVGSWTETESISGCWPRRHPWKHGMVSLFIFDFFLF